MDLFFYSMHKYSTYILIGKKSKAITSVTAVFPRRTRNMSKRGAVSKQLDKMRHAVGKCGESRIRNEDSKIRKLKKKPKL